MVWARLTYSSPIYVPFAEKQNFIVPTRDPKGNVYEFRTRYVFLNASVNEIVVVDCSATGYPYPTYTWQLNGKDINDSCGTADVKDGGKVWQVMKLPFQTLL